MCALVVLLTAFHGMLYVLFVVYCKLQGILIGVLQLRHLRSLVSLAAYMLLVGNASVT